MSFKETVVSAIVGGMFGLGGMMVATYEPPLEIVEVVGGIGLTASVAVRIAFDRTDDGDGDGALAITSC